MVKDIVIKEIKTRKDILFQDVPNELADVIFKMLDNWNKTT